jgi:hypothetical protein
MRVNLYDVADDGREILTDENVLLSDCYPGPENDEDYYHAHSTLARTGVYYTGGGAAPDLVLRCYFHPDHGVAPVFRVYGFEPIRPLRAPDDGSPYYVDAMASCGSPRVDYGSSDWPSRSYMLVLA